MGLNGGCVNEIELTATQAISNGIYQLVNWLGPELDRQLGPVGRPLAAYRCGRGHQQHYRYPLADPSRPVVAGVGTSNITVIPAGV